MRTWLPILGVLVVIAATAFLRSEAFQHEVAALFEGGSDPAPAAKPVCEPGVLHLSANACTPAVPSGRFVVSTALTVSQQGVGMPNSRRVLSNSGAIQAIADAVNESLALPHDVPVQLKACGEVNAFYHADTQSISICDEFVDALSDAFADVKDQERFSRLVLAATAFTFAHEVGHALLDQYKLGFLGREEDVADQFAVYLLAGSPVGQQEVLAGAEAFGRFAKAGANGLVWDSHSLSSQRYFNILCWSYGSNPGAYPVVLTNGHLPLDRALSCQDEYQKMAADFDQKLAPHSRVRRGLLSN